MSSRALRAVKTSLGGEDRGGGGGGGRRVSGAVPSSTTVKRPREEVGQSPDPVQGSTPALPKSFRVLEETYEKVCFIFGIHSNNDRRTLRDLQEAFHQLCGRKVRLDELRQLRSAYPGCLAFGYRGLSSKPLSLDLTVQIPKEGGRPCSEKHKRVLRKRLLRLAQRGGGLPLSDLPERPSNRSLEESEKYVKKVIQSYSPKRNRVGAPGQPSSSTIKSFFQTNKLVSSGALDMVERTHNKMRKLFDESELEERRRRRNVAQLPALFDRLRGLFRSHNRRAMPLKDVLPHLMSMRRDKSIQLAEIEEQLKLIVDEAPEWCTVQTDTRNNKILSTNLNANPNVVRRKLSLLSQDLESPKP
ncbi:hypothetical protein HOP50_04g32140 [Chloropicon primus]|uniref:DNA replication factor Cdt1 C-terminal domain-containing protein n=1 Tax=Chloropicon primus TaxID=1764295 RepID=A0A5B8MMW5_9CHLO|nr:hypothetical protein A3770_04p32100 [Chloropicon primus]UPQ99904.1 hypothetical protein HOP50_04g32140 [Chloropicon primus]|eukprot:QDZ20692.1 hypothetical protein A3770_04p32100 [Chloropicon primus]